MKATGRFTVLIGYLDVDITPVNVKGDLAELARLFFIVGSKNRNKILVGHLKFRRSRPCGGNHKGFTLRFPFPDVPDLHIGLKTRFRNEWNLPGIGCFTGKDIRVVGRGNGQRQASYLQIVLGVDFPVPIQTVTHDLTDLQGTPCLLGDKGPSLIGIIACACGQFRTQDFNDATETAALIIRVVRLLFRFE